MTPRNAEERAVVKLHDRLPSASIAQMNWMIGQTYERSRTNYEGQKGRKKKVENYDYYCIITTFRGWQVVRHFLVLGEYGRKGHFLRALSEVSQRWMRYDRNGRLKLHIFERAKGMSWMYHNQPYCLNSALDLKSWNTGRSRNGRTYFSYADYEIYPRRSFTDEFLKSGQAVLLGRCDEIVQRIICDNGEIGKKAEKIGGSVKLDRRGVMPLTKKCYLPNICETLFKMGEPRLAQDIISGAWWTALVVSKYWKSFLVAHRHGLHNLPHWKDWFDYVEDLERIGRDIHSPKYLVPADLGKAHAKVIDIIERNRAQIEAEKIRKEIETAEPDYQARMAKYFHIAFKSAHLTYRPIQSVFEMHEEGARMHHCVYSRGYYKPTHNTSLILTARDAESGMRVETIEVNLASGTIVQSRGVCNKPSDRHDEILKAVQGNMELMTSIYNKGRVVA